LAGAVRRATFALALALALVTPGWGDESRVSDVKGHPFSRFPLSISIARFDDDVERAFYRAVGDWNAVFREALGVSRPAFVIYAAESGLIHVPIRIDIRQTAARAGVSRETFFYRVIARELGHALGLRRVDNPRSPMCCVKHSPDDSQALPNADIRSVRRQLAEHYAAFWAIDGP
jgi:hypothetical protein